MRDSTLVVVTVAIAAAWLYRRRSRRLATPPTPTDDPTKSTDGATKSPAKAQASFEQEELLFVAIRLALDSCVQSTDALMSPHTIRRVMSRVRCACLDLDDGVDPDAAARFPINLASERTVQEAVVEAAAAEAEAAAAAGTPELVDKRLLQLGRCAAEVLASMPSCASAVQLAVACHTASLHSSAAAAAADAPPRVSGLMETREVAGERGFYAKQTLSEGTLVLAEQPHCFAGDEDDFAGLLSAHVLGRGDAPAASDGF